MTVTTVTCHCVIWWQSDWLLGCPPGIEGASVGSNSQGSTMMLTLPTWRSQLPGSSPMLKLPSCLSPAPPHRGGALLARHWGYDGIEFKIAHHLAGYPSSFLCLSEYGTSTSAVCSFIWLNAREKRLTTSLCAAAVEALMVWFDGLMVVLIIWAVECILIDYITFADLLFRQRLLLSRKFGDPS